MMSKMKIGELFHVKQIYKYAQPASFNQDNYLRSLFWFLLQWKTKV